MPRLLRRLLVAVFGMFGIGVFGSHAQAGAAFTSPHITVEVRGAGPDVILTPGLASSRAVWESLAERLDGAYRLHLVQVVGFGEPNAPPAGPVFDPVAREIQRYITEAGLKRPAFIGHSMGGVLGLHLATAEPTLFGRLMVVDALPFFSVLINPALTAETARPVAVQSVAAMTAMTSEAFAAQQARTMRTLVKSPQGQARALGWSVASHRQTMATAMGEVMTLDLRPRLGDITIPAAILYAYDPAMIFPARYFDDLYARNYAGLPAAALQRIDGALHFIMLDQPDAFAEAVKAFLR